MPIAIGPFGQLTQQFERPGEVGDRFGVCDLPGRSLSCPSKVLDCFGHIAAAPVMMRKFGQMVLQPLGEQRFERFGRTLVNLPAALHQHRVVGDFKGQRMLEDVF
ncbi:MAG TPA: hypothetical protein VFE56_09480, partial [Candidatus Binataceae bacterium]|nr:hypothetical protein [Candidatus Binataceae bacterium]